MPVTFDDLLRTFGRVGLLSFGGPAGQIALMHRILVDERKWLGEAQFLNALNFCMLLPGPEAMQLATYAGWRLHGIKGGLAAGLLFVLPGAAVVLALSMIYAHFGEVPWIAAIFYGIKAAVLAIVVEALLRVARRALKTQADWLIAALAFLALFAFDVPFPLIVLAAGLFGFWRASNAGPPLEALPPWRAAARHAAIWAAVWLVPLALIVIATGPGHVFADLGVFFSTLAVVTFGGAYAVLSYMAQAAVETHGWLTAHDMITGLGLAETTPGPLILVTEFVGYLAGASGTGSPWGGVAGALIALWMTFAPCFLWIFAGAAYVDHIGKRPRASGALAAITAAVVGVILNLSVWFGLNVLFGKVERLPHPVFKPWLPDLATLDAAALVLSLIAAAALLKLHLGIARTLALCAALGLGWRLAG